MMRIALVGYGEVGRTLAKDLAASGRHDLLVWDKLFRNHSSRPSRAVLEDAHVRAAHNMAEAVTARDLVISAVTAAECIAAVKEAAPSLSPDTTWFDLNSVAPRTKSEAASVVDSAGGRYVEAAVMSPIGPKRIASPMLLGGPHAATFLTQAHALGFTGAKVFADAYGRASAAKMCRSVMVKGIEALVTESLLSARHYGVEATVLDSLKDLFPGSEWPRLARYMISRSLEHGHRRAEEMREVARTIEDAGLTPWMSTACAERQEWAAQHAYALDHEELTALLDSVLERRETFA